MTAHEGATVLVVEDEPSIADVLTIALRYHRFEVMVASTVRQALTLAERTRPDAALLDVMLPDGDGRALGRELRLRQPDLAIVFLTARDAPAEIVGALGFGDDYITKPFNIDEVVARITAVLRRTRTADILPGGRPCGTAIWSWTRRRTACTAGTARWSSPPPSTPCCASWYATAVGSSPRNNSCVMYGSTSTLPSRPSWRRTSATCAASWNRWARR